MPKYTVNVQGVVQSAVVGDGVRVTQQFNSGPDRQEVRRMKEFSYDADGYLIFNPGDTFYVPVTAPQPPLQLRVIRRQKLGRMRYRYLVEQFSRRGWITDEDIWFLGKIPVVMPWTFEPGG